MKKKIYRMRTKINIMEREKEKEIIRVIEFSLILTRNEYIINNKQIKYFKKWLK